MNNPIKCLTGNERLLWLASLAVVVLSNLLSGDVDVLTLLAALVGVTSLIFAAKGNPAAERAAVYGSDNDGNCCDGPVLSDIKAA